MVNFKTTERKKYTLVEFELNQLISPADLENLQPPEVKGTKGVILSGKAPIWLYGMLIHHYHPTAFIGVYEPRIGGGVVVASHNPAYKIGDVIPMEVK